MFKKILFSNEVWTLTSGAFEFQNKYGSNNKLWNAKMKIVHEAQPQSHDSYSYYKSVQQQ